MAVEARQDPATRPGALKRIADQLGVHPEALRTWVKRAEVDCGVRPGTTTDDAERIAQLERENRELRRANTILKQASAYVGDRCQVPVSPSRWMSPSKTFCRPTWPLSAASSR
ncbi:Transposase [Rhodococcus qingshengii]|nr:transposase [Rhodococcus sp. 008]SCC70368.1 Transposase [Rhodococcus qingshengii]